MEGDVASAHSAGWILLEEPPVDEHGKRVVTPDYKNAQPPTAENCDQYLTTITRVKRFYSEGEDKQNAQIAMLEKETEEWRTNKRMIEAQQAALSKYPPTLTRRRAMEKELATELKLVEMEIRARESARKRMDMLFAKRAEIVSTLDFLERYMKVHCASLGTGVSSQQRK